MGLECRREVGCQQDITAGDLATHLHGIERLMPEVSTDLRPHFLGRKTASARNLKCDQSPSLSQTITQRQHRHAVLNGSFQVSQKEGDSRFVPLDTEAAPMLP